MKPLSGGRPAMAIAAAKNRAPITLGWSRSGAGSNMFSSVSSTPVIGCNPRSRAAFAYSIAPYRLSWSVTASAG